MYVKDECKRNFYQSAMTLYIFFSMMSASASCFKIENHDIEFWIFRINVTNFSKELTVLKLIL